MLACISFVSAAAEGPEPRRTSIFEVPPWTYGLFNAGVWFVRNDFRGQFILDSWMSSYDAKHWFFNKVSNEWTTDGSWAGDTYEQGAFHKILGADFLKRYVQYIDQEIIQNTDAGCDNGKVKHFPGNLGRFRDQFVRDCLAADFLEVTKDSWERLQVTESQLKQIRSQYGMYR